MGTETLILALIFITIGIIQSKKSRWSALLGTGSLFVHSAYLVLFVDTLSRWEFWLQLVFVVFFGLAFLGTCIDREIIADKS